ncbi:MAG: hypothetical protein RLY84_315 [Actinomycetota bacterium]|jgi:phosphonatase-like hydrolase
MIKLAVFDIAGTILSDDGVVIDCFSSAFKEVVPSNWKTHQAEFVAYARETMGQSKIEVFRHLLQSDDLAMQAADAFQRHYLATISKLKLFDGVILLFDALRASGIQVALNTGFNRETLEVLLDKFHLRESIDASATQTEAGEGRPSPAMIELVANQLGVGDRETVAVIGDTKSDIVAGINFGAGLKIGVTTGEHDFETLDGAGADFVISHVTQVDQLLS